MKFEIVNDDRVQCSKTGSRSRDSKRRLRNDVTGPGAQIGSRCQEIGDADMKKRKHFDRHRSLFLSESWYGV